MIPKKKRLKKIFSKKNLFKKPTSKYTLEELPEYVIILHKSLTVFQLILFKFKYSFYIITMILLCRIINSDEQLMLCVASKYDKNNVSVML